MTTRKEGWKRVGDKLTVTAMLVVSQAKSILAVKARKRVKPGGGGS